MTIGALVTETCCLAKPLLYHTMTVHWYPEIENCLPATTHQTTTHLATETISVPSTTTASTYLPDDHTPLSVVVHCCLATPLLYHTTTVHWYPAIANCPPATTH